MPQPIAPSEDPTEILARRFAMLTHRSPQRSTPFRECSRRCSPMAPRESSSTVDELANRSLRAMPFLASSPCKFPMQVPHASSPCKFAMPQPIVSSEDPTEILARRFPMSPPVRNAHPSFASTVHPVRQCSRRCPPTAPRESSSTVDELANRSLRAVENPTLLSKIDIRHYTTTTLRYVSAWRMSILLRGASAGPLGSPGRVQPETQVFQTLLSRLNRHSA